MKKFIVAIGIGLASCKTPIQSTVKTAVSGDVASLQPSVPARHLVNGMWVWNDELNFYDKNQRNELFGFSKQLGVHELYVNFPAGFCKKQEFYDFLREAQERNLNIYFLEGKSPVTSLELANEFTRVFRKYQECGVSNFQGFHLDFEGEWFKDNQALAKEYL